MLSRVPLFLFVAATATAALADATDDIVNAALREQHVPGAWVAVLKDGKVVKKSGYGLANIELGVKVTPETMMQTGSIGKMFTSEGILLLAKDGKLCLEDSLAKFFPGAPDWWKPITIRRMLSHTAGIPEYEGDKYSIDVKKEYTEDQMVDFVEKMAPDYSPGEKWAYSNTDYMLFGVIIHKLTGQFYADFLRDRVWNPAGMKTIRTNSDTDLIPNRAQGYETKKGQWSNQDWVSQSANSTADGTLMATADDFIAWDRALDAYKILPKDYQDQVWQEAKLNDGKGAGYGFAWVPRPVHKHKCVWHNGAWQGFRSVYMRFPDDRVSVVVFMNDSGAKPEGIAAKIADLFLPKVS